MEALKPLSLLLGAAGATWFLKTRQQRKGAMDQDTKKIYIGVEGYGCRFSV